MSSEGVVWSQTTVEALRDFAFAYYSEHEGPSESEHKARDLVEALDKDIACASQPLADPAPERPSDTRTLISCVRCGLAFAPEMLSELPSGPLCTDCLCESAAAQMPPPPDGDLSPAAQAVPEPIRNCMCGHCESWSDHGGGMGWCSEHNTMTVSGHTCKRARSKNEYAEPAGGAAEAEVYRRSWNIVSRQARVAERELARRDGVEIPEGVAGLALLDKRLAERVVSDTAGGAEAPVAEKSCETCIEWGQRGCILRQRDSGPRWAHCIEAGYHHWKFKLPAAPPDAPEGECPSIQELMHHHQEWADYGQPTDRPKARAYHLNAVAALRALAADRAKLERECAGLKERCAAFGCDALRELRERADALNAAIWRCSHSVEKWSSLKGVGASAFGDQVERGVKLLQDDLEAERKCSRGWRKQAEQAEARALAAAKRAEGCFLLPDMPEGPVPVRTWVRALNTGAAALGRGHYAYAMLRGIACTIERGAERGAENGEERVALKGCAAPTGGRDE